MLVAEDAVQGAGEALSLPPELLETFHKRLRAAKKQSGPNQKNISAFIKDLRPTFKGRLLEAEPMSRHSSIKIGGPADVYCLPVDLDDVRLIYATASRHHIPVHHHGAGSNTLIKDGGIRGAVLSLADLPADIRITRKNEEEIELEVDAGLALHALVRWTGKQGVTGMEHLAGIPASVGGAVTMNAGVPQGTILDPLTSLILLLPDGEEKIIPKNKLHFSYRKTELPSGALVLRACFCLKCGNAAAVQTAIASTLDGRKAKQPLQLPNLGSVFMNPTEEDVKLAWGKKAKTALPKAGTLIEEAGLKGVRVGGARISEKHANFIVNEGDASAEDVLVLIRLAKDKVKETSGIALKPEIKVIGED